MVGVKKKIVKNTIATSLLKAWKYIISFFLFPFTIHYIGIDDYGIYLLVGALVGYFGLLDLGFGQALIKYVAQFNAVDDKESINKMVNSTYIFFLVIGIIICCSTLIIGYFYVELFNVPSDQIDKARLIAYLVAIGALTSWPIKSFGTVLLGMQRYDINTYLGFMTSTANAVVTIILLISGYGIIELVLWGIIVGSIGQVISIIIISRLYPFITISRKYMTKETLQKILKFSSAVFIIQFSVLVILGTDRILIGAFVSVGAITLYAVARKLHDLVMTIPRLMTSAILPAASEMAALEQKEMLEKLIIKGGKYSCAAIFSFATVIFVLADPIIRYWMGSEEFMGMVIVTQVFVFYWFFNVGGMTESVLLAKEKFKPILTFTILNMVLNLIISVVLVSHIGIMGVVLGTVLPMMVLMPVYISWSFRILDISVVKYVKEALIPNYPLAIITGFLLYICVQILPINNLVTVGILSIFGLIIYYSLFYIMLNNDDKEEIKALVRSKV